MSLNKGRLFLNLGILIVLCLILLVNQAVLKDYKNINNNIRKIGAEQSGSSPESGATSKLKTAYDFLVSKGTNYGNTQPSDWTYSSYGTYWDRILYSASWEPDGTATEEDVLSGKTFYSGSSNRTIKLGTATTPTSPGASLQQYVQYDDSQASDYQGEESTWTKTNTTPSTEVWLDTRTGLYWARSEPTALSNSFTVISTGSCPFHTTTPRSDYGNSSTDPDCGNSINACAVLSLASISGQSDDTDWYLPSQKELYRAYIDGIYNQAGSSFTTSGFFWSSTEYSASSTNCWGINLYGGHAIPNAYTKNDAKTVSCVRRD